MSYLNLPRLTFAGLFQADPSTVNNDPTHYNNETFEPSFQDYQSGENLNGWWNPDGTGNWRLVGCKITKVSYSDGTEETDPTKDPVIGLSITDTENKTAAKIVDLDSQQQMVSMIWGLIVRITDGKKNLINGSYKPAAFTNIWFTRSPDLSHDAAAAAIYQSVIEDLCWDIDSFGSRYLNELKAASPEKLSIQFTLDRFNGDFTAADFTLGRIAGSIGPSYESEPDHFVIGRQLFPQAGSNCNYATALLDESQKTLILDLGNAFQFILNKESKKIVIADPTRNIVAAVDQGSSGNPDYYYLGKIEYTDLDWYASSAGVCTISLDDEGISLVKQFPLVLIDYKETQENTFTSFMTGSVLLQEFENYVCADQFVFQLNPGESCDVNLYATHLGNLIPDKTIELQLNNSFFGPTPPPVGVPKSILSFPPSIKTDSSGKATFTIKAGDPGNPREYIDGQVYGLAYSLSEDYFTNCNQSNFISLLVYDSVPQDKIDDPTWKDLLPTMQQYANLYPLMSKGIFNLADKNVVDQNAQILKLVFGKEKTDPNYMPATRDLSRDKLKMILNYLNKVIAASDPKDSITFKKI
ncbi:hypothetical protein [Algoriphagus sp. PAP.12]|uniref:hypothetical protein n=1 Tax=Algoriphagus sp. PAP.12 TaxID=2996678 RepID=UPI00227D6A26|nr:hypothetical protein [Algoriphagus sp. PAP.12]